MTSNQADSPKVSPAVRLAPSSFHCLEFDDILPFIGAFGYYQKRLIICMLPFAFCWAFIYLGQIFMTLVPLHHWCRIPELAKLSHQKQNELGIPLDKDGAFEHCSMYAVNYTEVLRTNATPNASWPTTGCRDGWIYNETEVPFETISTEYNWVCKDDALPAYAVTISFMGSIVGGIAFGYTADHWGRLPTLIICNACGMVGGILSAFCRNFGQFAITRFIAGLAIDNCFNMIYILTLEYVGPQYRTIVGNVTFALFYTPAACLLPWIAYWCNDWRLFALVTSVPVAIVLLLYFVLPESARWLISMGKYDRALTIIKKVARSNGKEIPEDVLIMFRRCCELYYGQERESKRYTVFHLFQMKRLRYVSIILIIIWMTISLLYDAHVRVITDIGTNIFITHSLANLTELPAGLILLPILDRFGRRPTAFLVLTGCAISSLFASVMVEKWKVAAAAIVGRFFASVAYNVGYQWTAEVLPTVVRGQGMAFIHVMGFVAALLSPFVVYTEHYSSALPLTILATLAVLGAVLSLFLPETLHTSLPQTLQEANDLGRGRRRKPRSAS